MEYLLIIPAIVFSFAFPGLVLFLLKITGLKEEPPELPWRK